MHSFVFFLVLFAAFTHALWNFFTKKVSGNFTIFWYGSAFTNALLFVYTLYYLSRTGIDYSGIIFILISATAHGFYYLAFLYTYEKGDISTAYPIARGTGVAGTAIISFFLLREIITPLAAFGIALVFSGIIFIGLSRSSSQVRQKRTYLVPMLTGVFIFIYSIADKQGVGYINPVVYINIVDMVALSFLFRAANRKGIAKSIKTVTANLKETLIIGFGSTGTYIIILFALQMERASYIVSMREFSVVLASIMGFVFLKEKPTLPKITGILLITAGLVMIKAG